ncbi:hypothetical protein CO151_00305 [bacterium CG_4_9_14_3_um_filter_65_15]|nr:MAG: hypothetical protein CO151_00305 [bacterium CG_4_9_14_3_um_filter_65_15]
MTMRTTTIMLAIILLLAVGTAQAADSAKVYGKGISAPDTVRISDVLANPDAFVGKAIRVTGLAVGVCAYRGCWINLASDTEGESLRVKVKDGEIVFPPEIMGESVTAEGVWTANLISLKPAEQVKDGEGKKNAACLVEGEDACKTVYQLSGTGAVVAGK